jgi:hypothetical protein
LLYNELLFHIQALEVKEERDGLWMHLDCQTVAAFRFGLLLFQALTDRNTLTNPQCSLLI